MARSLADKDNLVFSPGTEVTILIDHFGGNEGGVLALIVLRESDLHWRTCGLDDLFAHDLAVLAGHNLHLSGIEDDTPAYMILCVQWYGLVMHGIAAFGLFARLAAHTL